MISNEEKALQLSKSRGQLHQRLLGVRSCLSIKFRVLFSSHSFDFKKKQLITECGKYALQWKLRANPENPISYENQQTSVGIVVLEEVNILSRKVQ